MIIQTTQRVQRRDPHGHYLRPPHLAEAARRAGVGLARRRVLNLGARPGAWLTGNFRAIPGIREKAGFGLVIGSPPCRLTEDRARQARACRADTAASAIYTWDPGTRRTLLSWLNWR